MSTLQLPKPEYGKLFGITYDQSSRLPMVRAPRVLKVGIGIPKGRAIQVFLHNNTWHIRHGAWEKTSGRDKLVMKIVFKGGADNQPNTKEAAMAFHEKYKDKAAISNRPQKQSWFTFTRRTVVEDATGKPTESFEPDFDAIEAHGNCPRRIRVILASENPLRQADEWWTASELKCHGDGLLAERVLAAGSAKDEYWQEAKDQGLKMFPYTKCRLSGCEHAGVDCKQHSSLEIQLAYALRLGATAYFTSTGGVTAGQLFSSLTTIREPLERLGFGIVGAELDLVLGNFRANHDGKPSIQPCVSLELTASSAAALKRVLAESSWSPARLGEGSRMLAASDDFSNVDTELAAAAIDAEFSDAEFEDGSQEDAPVVVAAAVQTQAKQADLGEKLRKAKESTAAPVAAAAPAPAPVVEVTATAVWSDRAGMNAALLAEKERLGDGPFNEHVSKAGVLLGSLKFDDPKALALFKALKDDDGSVF